MSKRKPTAVARSGNARKVPAEVQPLTDIELLGLEAMLAEVPEPLLPLGVSALDGYLCGVLLQPIGVPLRQWWPWVCDTDGRPPPTGWNAEPLRTLVLRRHAELDAAIGARRWFDPWLLADDDAEAGAEAVEAVAPWVTGFAFAMECFPTLIDRDDPALTHPLALIFRHLDANELEDADDVREEIESLEPPATLDAAVEELVRATLLLADIGRPAVPQR